MVFTYLYTFMSMINQLYYKHIIPNIKQYYIKMEQFIINNVTHQSQPD